MFGRNRFLTFPTVIGAVLLLADFLRSMNGNQKPEFSGVLNGKKLKSQESSSNGKKRGYNSHFSFLVKSLCKASSGMIGVVSGKAIFGPPLAEYWKKKIEEEAAAKENDGSST
ncbi:hypothetical protein F8388_017322 [Cannabis sativa]|uniref:Uncharacterized protein n=1 Tax=Cannabis sativa TaxID=3483 RepID=A0A7J6I4X3_CANSA|nr:hypothetical protein F8388_017322 [Cannabis sativa]KAF4402069.1 hypothetical protein G4B88_017581 [Cannabis sativa]